jgi:hypothetical protein
LTDALKVPGLSDSENVTLNLLVEQLDQKQRRNRLRSSYYDGRRAVKQISGVIPPQYQELALVLGWAAKGVDGLARRCNLDQMVWANGDLDALGMEALSDSNFLQSEFDQAETDSLIHGVSYLISTRGDESAGEPAALIHSKDALNATGDWNSRSRSLNSLLSVTSWRDNSITGFVLYLPNLTISADKPAAKWTVTRSEHTFGVPAEPLVYRPRSSRRMGRSRITRPVMSIQDSALRALVRMEAHMDIYAIPKLFMLGADEGIFKNADGTPKNSWQVVMGRNFGIPDDEDASNTRAEVQQFAAESPQPHLAQLNALAKLMARETDLSDAAFAMTDLANPTSADSYIAGSQELISEAESTTDSWSIPIQRTVRRALAIQNGLSEVPADWSGIKPKWVDAQYISRSAAADAGVKQLSAIPWLADTEIGLELLGLDKGQISRALAEKRKAAGRNVLAALGAQPAAAAPAVVASDANPA